MDSGFSSACSIRPAQLLDAREEHEPFNQPSETTTGSSSHPRRILFVLFCLFFCFSRRRRRKRRKSSALAWVPCFLTSHSQMTNVWNVKKYGANAGPSTLKRSRQSVRNAHLLEGEISFPAEIVLQMVRAKS